MNPYKFKHVFCYLKNHSGPSIPCFRRAATGWGKALLSRRYPNGPVVSELTDTRSFVDQVENVERVSCNLCGTEIDPVDWQNARDHAYEMPADFAKFVILIKDAAEEIRQPDCNEPEQVLGTKLRTIRARY